MVMIPVLLAAALAQSQPPIAQPIVIGQQPPRILSLRPGEARCGEAPQRPVHAETVTPVGVTYFPENLTADALTVRLTFKIDRAGRPVSISQAADNPLAASQARDLVPAFSVWRFAPGAAREDCEISFEAQVRSFASAPLPDIHRMLILGRSSPAIRSAAARRVQPASSTCFNPPPIVRQRTYPAFERIPQAPGTAAYSLVAFDIDASGRPINLSLADSTGNTELDRQSLDAIRRSRFAPEAKRGCNYPYWRRGDTPVAAPPVPEVAAFRRPDATCSEKGATWVQLPKLVFPPEFLTRGIEGWALVSYDVAPWGAVGNLKVLEAQPAARFGAQAESIVRQARGAASDRGATGCVDRVIFRVPARGERPRPDSGED